jgi:protein-tyrosine phosphatase
MKYAAVFTLLAACLGLLAVESGGAAVLLLWPAASFLLFALAYAMAAPRLLGKRPDGRIAWWSWLLYAPVFLLLWGIWRVQSLLSREPPCQEVAPGLWLSRRLRAHELPAGIGLIVDLTAEFPAARGLVGDREYLLLATLDGRAPEETAFRAAIDRVTRSPCPVLVHCAMGHGRSAALAAAVLLARGLARDAREAEGLLRKVRPGVRLNAGQRGLVQRYSGARAE